MPKPRVKTGNGTPPAPAARPQPKGSIAHLPSFLDGMLYMLALYSDQIGRDVIAMNRALSDCHRAEQGLQPPRLMQIGNMWFEWRAEAHSVRCRYDPHARAQALTKTSLPAYACRGRPTHRDVNWSLDDDDDDPGGD